MRGVSLTLGHIVIGQNRTISVLDQTAFVRDDHRAVLGLPHTHLDHLTRLELLLQLHTKKVGRGGVE